MENYDKLPEKYKELPIAIWALKSDSSIALTLLNDIVLKITEISPSGQVNGFDTI